MNPNTFIGTTILTSKTNEYLVIHDQQKPKVYVFKNLNCQRVFNFDQNE